MKSLFLLLLTLLLLFTPSTITAHGGPPFISINSSPNQPNPAGSGSVFFKVANEISEQNYVVNENLKFTIDKSLLPVDPTQISENNFIWDFANGSVATGLVAETTYKKAGSYIVILKVKDPNQDPVELESMQVNILPNKTYTPPSAVIMVNGKKITDPFKEPVLVEKNSEVEFSASASKGDIKKFQWDFADGSKLETGETVRHKFDFSQPYAYSFFPIVRVEDENGLFSDAVVQIAGDDNVENKKATASSTTKSNSYNLLLYAIGGLVVLILVSGIFLTVKRKK